MKNILAIFFFILSIQGVFAQTTKFGIKVGYNYASSRASYAGIKQPVTAKSGFGLALTTKLDFDGILHFPPYVGYNLKGFIINPKTGNTKKEEYTIHYFDIATLLSLDFTI